MSFLRLLRNGRIRGLAGAGFIAEAGDWMLLIALPLYVLELTSSPFATATVLFLGLAPTVIAGPLAGVLVDRSEPWKLMTLVAALQAACLIPLVAVNDGSDLWILYCVVIIESILGTIIEPCRAVTAASLVPSAQLPVINQLMGVLSSLSRLIGSPVGGLILVVGGFDAVILTNASLFLAACVVFAFGTRGQKAIRHDTGTNTPSSPWEDLVEGLQVTMKTPPLRRVMGVTSLVAIAQGGFVLLFVLFVIRDIQGTEADVGVLRGVQAIGALIGGGMLGLVINRIEPGRLISGSLLILGVISLVIWNLPVLTTSFPVYIGLFILIGVPGVALMTGLLTVLQSNCEPRARGRVLSVFFALYGTMQAIGSLLAGFLGTGIGLTMGLQIQGLLYLVAGAIALKLAQKRTDQNLAAKL